VLELAQIDPPEVVAGVPQMPIHGASLVPTLDDENASPRRDVQYFEMLGHRGIWSQGWKAVTHHDGGTPFDDDAWELYQLDEDFSECRDLADAQPERVQEMVDLWWREAEQHGVLPLDDRGAAQLFRASRRPGLPTSRNRFVYHPPVSHIVSDACPPVARGWTMTVDLEHPSGDADGALVARGSANSGFVLYLKQGRLLFDYNAFHAHTLVSSEAALPAGKHEIELRVERGEDRSGAVTLSVDGEVAAEGQIPLLLRILSSTGMDLGRSLAPVTNDYEAPFEYPGRIQTVIFELPEGRGEREAKAEATAEAKAQGRASMTRQ
jgi:arylsulfatase